jgi:glutamate/tyrosine decarboxylase-like PLP-dependent enzyme
MSDFTAFLAIITLKALKSIEEDGLLKTSKQLMSCCSKFIHTWIDKATILFGHGSNSIRWIPTDVSNKVNVDSLQQTIKTDLEQRYQAFVVVVTTGGFSTGVVGNLEAIVAIWRAYNLWFHIDVWYSCGYYF